MGSDLPARLATRAVKQASAPVYALLFLSSICQMTLVPLLPTVAHRYDLGAASMAWLLALPSLAQLVSASPLGLLGDRIGNHRATAAAGLVMAVSILAQAIPSLSALIVARITFGVGFGALWTVGLGFLAGLDAERWPRRMASSVTYFASGAAIGPMLSGVLASRVGFAAPFVFAGAATMVAACLLVAFPMPTTAEPAHGFGRRHNAPPVIAHRIAGPRWRPVLRGSTFAALRRPAILASMASLALSAGVTGLLQLLVPLQLHASGYSAQQIGVVLSLGGLAYIGGSALCIFLGSRISSARTNALLSALQAVALVPALIGSGLAWVGAAVVLCSVPRSAIGTVAFTLAMNDRDSNAPGPAAVSGLLNSSSAAAAVLVPVIAGSISALGGPRWAYAAAIAAASATALLLLKATPTATRLGLESRV